MVQKVTTVPESFETYMEKENEFNQKKKRRLDESNCKSSEKSCFNQIKDVNYHEDTSNSNYASKLQSKIDMHHNIPTDRIKMTLLNGKNLDLNMYTENFNCFEVNKNNMKISN